MKTIQKKICLLGDFAVGKTSLVRQFVEGRFSDKYQSTIGVKISRRVIDRAEHKLNFVIWDLAGESSMKAVNGSYLKGAAGAIIACDLTRESTLISAMNYASLLRESSPSAAVVLVGNKADLTELKQITTESLSEVARAINADFYLTSAKTGDNVSEAFVALANQIEAK